MRRLMIVVLLLTAVTVAAKDNAPADGLSRKLHEVIGDVEAAYAAGDIEKVWHLLAAPTNGLKEDLAAKFDDALTAKKLSPARELLVQARLKLLMENRTGALPAPTLRERLLILEALHEHVQNPLAQVAGLTEEAPPPKNMDAFDRRFRDIRDVQKKLWLAKTCGSYGRDVASKLPAAARKKLTDKQQETVANSEGDMTSKVQDAEGDVRELELETHLLRLKYGVDVLRQKELTKEKFIAAATTRQDARVLKQALTPPVAAPAPAQGTKGKSPKAKAAANPPPAPPAPPAPPVSFHRKSLTSPNLANEVATLARHAEEAAGPLADKAERFFVGLEFWLRGRYGWGPEVWGLAKSEAALKKPELLQQVFMPDNLLVPAEEEEKDKPKQPAAAGGRTETRSTGTYRSANAATEKKPPQTPKSLDRRHHYTWAWEDRRLVTTSAAGPQNDVGLDTVRLMGWIPLSGGMAAGMAVPSGGPLSPDFANWMTKKEMSGQGGETTQSAGKTVQVPPQDPRLVYRIVGFLEYAQAVQYLDKFVEEASIPEFEVAEEIIRSQEAFRIDTNLSRRIESPSPLTELSPNPRDDFSRHGLEWMLALARVELGAMLAGFTTHAEPFLSQAPTIFRQERVKTVPFGTAAYGEMLLDGLRTHYWSIMRSGLIESYYKTGIPENHLLTYGRRAIVGRQLVRAVLTIGGGANPAQQTTLQTWEQTFEKLQRMMLYCLTFKVGVEKATINTYTYTLLAPAAEAQNERAGRVSTPDSIGTSSTTTYQRDPAPDMIRRLLLLTDPTLVGCGCK